LVTDERPGDQRFHNNKKVELTVLATALIYNDMLLNMCQDGINTSTYLVIRVKDDDISEE
jgi:hypothetical protein